MFKIIKITNKTNFKPVQELRKNNKTCDKTFLKITQIFRHTHTLFLCNSQKDGKQKSENF